MTKPCLLAISVSLLFSITTSAEERPFALMVGDQAPKIEVAKWVKGAPVATFQPGQTYLLDFWATWCPPCRRGIPHLSELQKQYKDRLTIIGVSVWEPRAHEVEPFVTKLGDRMDYTIALDDCAPAPAETKNVSKWNVDHGKMSVAWMKASGWAEQGIPAAFIVDREGRIAWIGEPEEELDDVLAKVVEGNWNLATESVNYRHRLELARKVEPIQKRLDAALGQKKWAEAVQCCDEMLALDPVGSAHIAGSKFQTLLTQVKDADQAYAFARQAIDKVAAHSAPALGQIAYVIVNMSADGKAHLDLALEAANRANQVAKGRRPGVLETLAQIYFLR